MFVDGFLLLCLSMGIWTVLSLLGAFLRLPGISFFHGFFRVWGETGRDGHLIWFTHLPHLEVTGGGGGGGGCRSKSRKSS